MRAAILIAMLSLPLLAQAQDSPVGRWKTIDDATGKGKPIKGMTILWGLKPDGKGKWSGGHVLDPENGKTYKSRLELLDGGGKLGMSGCVAFFCRQQVWIRQ